MDVEKKIKEDMKALGCTSNMKISLACHLYLYLVDEKLMYDTEYCYNKDIDTLYVLARPNKDEKINIYVPVPTHQDVTMKLISVLQENLCTIETGPTINLVFIDGDFTTTMYTFSKGLIDRPLPEKLAKLKAREDRRTFINSELKKQRNDIVNNALNGGLVDDDDCLVLD